MPAVIRNSIISEDLNTLPKICKYSFLRKMWWLVPRGSGPPPPAPGWLPLPLAKPSRSHATAMAFKDTENHSWSPRWRFTELELQLHCKIAGQSVCPLRDTEKKALKVKESAQMPQKTFENHCKKKSSWSRF